MDGAPLDPLRRLPPFANRNPSHDTLDDIVVAMVETEVEKSSRDPH